MRIPLLGLATAIFATAALAPTAGATVTGDTSFTAPAFSAFTKDTLGANDAPGQKDLTGHATKLTTEFFVAWKWDDTSINGGNTGDACALFDTNDSDNADAAICVTFAGKPAVHQSTRVYTCGDGKNDRCTSTYTEKTPIASKCQVNNEAAAEFGSGLDTQATCLIALADFGADSPSDLLNTCSYPSREPTSAPSDCVLIPGVRETGAIEITKTGADATCTGTTLPTGCQSAGVRLLSGGQFSITGTDAPSGAGSLTTGSNGKVCLDGFPTGNTYTVTENTAPFGYQIDDLSADLGVQASKPVTVSSASTCSSSPATVSFTDSPLSGLQVIFTSAAGTGVTLSQIMCQKGTTVINPTAGADAGDSPSTPTRDDTNETFSGLTAGVYTCTIDVNP